MGKRGVLLTFITCGMTILLLLSNLIQFFLSQRENITNSEFIAGSKNTVFACFKSKFMDVIYGRQHFLLFKKKQIYLRHLR